MITKQQIRAILDENLPGPYVKFQRKDLIAQQILALISNDFDSDKPKSNKKTESFLDKSE